MSAGLAPTSAEPKLLTAEEFLRRSPDLSEDLVRGRIVPMSRPTDEHGMICTNIAGEFRNFVRPRKLGIVTSNDAAIVTARGPDTVRGADVAFHAAANLVDGQFPPSGRATAPPVLVVEVRSKSDRRGEIETKVGEYLAVGVKVVAVFDPKRKNITQYGGDSIQVFGPDDEWTIPDVLPGFAVKVRELAEA